MEKEIKKIVESELSKSKKMIGLYELGLNIKEVSVIMGVRYQFSYNVISNYCRMNGFELRKIVKESRKDEIKKMIDEGLNNIEISSELRCSYNYVYGIRKEYELEKEKVKKVK